MSAELSSGSVRSKRFGRATQRSENHARAQSRRTRKRSRVVSASRSRAPNRAPPYWRASHFRSPWVEILQARDSSSNETAHFNHESAVVEATAMQFHTHKAPRNGGAEILAKFAIRHLSFHLHKH